MPPVMIQGPRDPELNYRGICALSYVTFGIAGQRLDITTTNLGGSFLDSVALSALSCWATDT